MRIEQSSGSNMGPLFLVLGFFAILAFGAGGFAWIRMEETKAEELRVYEAHLAQQQREFDELQKTREEMTAGHGTTGTLEEQLAEALQDADQRAVSGREGETIQGAPLTALAATGSDSTTSAKEATSSPAAGSEVEAEAESEEGEEDEQELQLIAPKRLDVIETPSIVVPWNQAPDYMGQTIAAEGRIVATHNSGRACFLNFDKQWQGKFHAVIFARSFGDYEESPEKWFLDRKIRLIGKVGEHRGTPQIVVERPEQIVLLDD